MNSNTIIGAIIAVVLLGLGIWYVMSTGTPTDTSTATSTPTTSNNGTPTGTNNSGTPAAGANTFRSIFTQSGNNECSYELVDGSSRSSSKIQIADGKMHGEFRTVTGNTSVASIMIYDGGYLYSWQEGKTTGKKTSITSLSQLPQAIPVDLSSGVILGKSLDNVSWDCHPWSKDAKVFVIPTYVKFS